MGTAFLWGVSVQYLKLNERYAIIFYSADFKLLPFSLNSKCPVTLDQRMSVMEWFVTIVLTTMLKPYTNVTLVTDWMEIIRSSVAMEIGLERCHLVTQVINYPKLTNSHDLYLCWAVDHSFAGWLESRPFTLLTIFDEIMYTGRRHHRMVVFNQVATCTL